MEIEYYKKEVYGITRYYLVDEKIRNWFYNLTMRKTVSTADMRTIEYMFNVKFKEVIQ